MTPRFRAWIVAEKRMVDVTSIDFDEKFIGHDRIIVDPNDSMGFEENTKEFDEIILEQSTGLTDCEGEEIFEGDKLSVTIEDEFYGSVVWNKKGAGFGLHTKLCHELDDIEIDIYEAEGRTLFIDGNIHESQEVK